MDRGSQLDDYRCTLRKLAVRDDRYIEALLQSDRENAALAGLDPQAHALVRMGALIAVNAAPPAYMNAVEAALAAGASHEQIVGTLIAVLPLVGEARVVSAAPNLVLALGYDVGDALEAVEHEPV
jgi:alkylhydroperoxidase/carboxymuconolactone decarboxylase family protein YurZ